ncbi:MAG: hypothetical protein ACREXP_21160, partial [Steroidobacteraceae bacterium]
GLGRSPVTYLYEIFNKKTGKTQKYGVTGTPPNKNGLPAHGRNCVPARTTASLTRPTIARTSLTRSDKLLRTIAITTTIDAHGDSETVMQLRDIDIQWLDNEHAPPCAARFLDLEEGACGILVLS